MAIITLSEIYVYPVKSLAGIRVSSWPVVKTGLQYDRQWMLIDAEGQFLSQRRLPRMALISTALNEAFLTLSAPGMPPLNVQIAPEAGKGIINSTVWHDTVAAVHPSEAADDWFSHFLQIPCQLVYLPDTEIRTVDQNYAKPDDQTAFSDGFPFLLVSENSLMALNKAMSLSLPMSRFRPNLVVSGCHRYAEDIWREITIGSLDFRITKPCSRCSVPTIDPVTGESGKEPLTTLNKTRKWENKVYFGQNALHNSTGILSVGDTVHVKLTGTHRPPLEIILD